MSVDLFLTLLITSTIITILLAEALKKLLIESGVPYRTNAVVLDAAMVASTGVAVIYRLPFGIGFEPMQLYRLVMLIICVWFVSMLAYDKMLQTVQQYKRYNELKKAENKEEDKQ